MEFYEKFGFSLVGDDTDGRGIRIARMTHGAAPYLMLNLRDNSTLLAPYKEFDDNDLPVAVAFALMSSWDEEFFGWQKLIFESFNEFVIKDVSQPYGDWIYLKDPAGNNILFTSSDFY
ncbi:hypothetical protein [Variovorax paradoxus]|uniref:hypothetical protein n=1 Tax=Variovorax paradoxus TaxID=34073 RepID=UPI0012D3A3E1|nr:hypothetical protein [Variovorax paradoxus]